MSIPTPNLRRTIDERWLRWRLVGVLRPGLPAGDALRVIVAYPTFTRAAARRKAKRRNAVDVMYRWHAAHREDARRAAGG